MNDRNRNRSDAEIRNEAERDVLIGQLITGVNDLTSEVRGMRENLGQINVQLTRGDGRMDQLEERIEVNREHLTGEISNVRRDMIRRVDHVDERLDEHEAERRQSRGRWAGIVPQIVAGVVTAILSAALVGGLLVVKGTAGAAEPETNEGASP